MDATKYLTDSVMTHSRVVGGGEMHLQKTAVSLTSLRIMGGVCDSPGFARDPGKPHPIYYGGKRKFGAGGGDV